MSSLCIKEYISWTEYKKKIQKKDKKKSGYRRMTEFIKKTREWFSRVRVCRDLISDLLDQFPNFIYEDAKNNQWKKQCSFRHTA